MTNRTRLYIPPRTPLSSVWRVVDDNGEVRWEVWTHCNDRNARYENFLGTSITLYNDGAAVRCTERGDTMIDMLDIMPKIGE